MSSSWSSPRSVVAVFVKVVVVLVAVVTRRGCRGEALPLAVPGCAFGHGVGSEECQLRREVSRVAGQFRECFDFDALECNTSQLCRWGAQSSGACGFDEDAMLGLLHIPDEQPMMQASPKEGRSRSSDDWPRSL